MNAVTPELVEALDSGGTNASPPLMPPAEETSFTAIMARQTAALESLVGRKSHDPLDDMMGDGDDGMNPRMGGAK